MFTPIQPQPTWQQFSSHVDMGQHTALPGQHSHLGHRGQWPLLPASQQASPVASLQGRMHHVQDVGGLAVVHGARQKQERGACARVWVLLAPRIVSPVKHQLPAVCCAKQLTVQSSGQGAPESQAKGTGRCRMDAQLCGSLHRRYPQRFGARQD